MPLLVGLVTNAENGPYYEVTDPNFNVIRYDDMPSNTTPRIRQILRALGFQTGDSANPRTAAQWFREEGLRRLIALQAIGLKKLKGCKTHFHRACRRLMVMRQKGTSFREINAAVRSGLRRLGVLLWYGPFKANPSKTKRDWENESTRSMWEGTGLGSQEPFAPPPPLPEVPSLPDPPPQHPY